MVSRPISCSSMSPAPGGTQRGGAPNSPPKACWSLSSAAGSGCSPTWTSTRLEYRRPSPPGAAPPRSPDARAQTREPAKRQWSGNEFSLASKRSPHRGVSATALEQFFVRTDLGDLPTGQGDDPVGLRRGREPVRDDERRPPRR